jgi:hypothetical protein
MRIGIKVFIVFAAISFVTPLLRAADIQWPAKLGVYSLGGPYMRSVDPPESTDPVLRESGLKTWSARGYVQGEHRIGLTLYTFKDSSGAYEALNSVLVGVAKEGDPTPHTIYKSNLVLSISTESEVDRETLNAISKWVESLSDGVAAPPIAGYLPEQSQTIARYALGPAGFRAYAAELGRSDAAVLAEFAGFGSHAEAMFAKYKSGKEEATLLLIDYPTPQLAELHLRHLQRALADAKLTTSSIERKGSLLSIVLAPTSPEYAAKLRAGVNYETQVTWNEASQAATDPPILSTVAKIFIATGVFMVVTVVIGIAFGGVRIITKRLFPGKVFDRKDQIEVLQLGLSGKPIDPSDMY